MENRPKNKQFKAGDIVRLTGTDGYPELNRYANRDLVVRRVEPYPHNYDVIHIHAEGSGKADGYYSWRFDLVRGAFERSRRRRIITLRTKGD